MTLIEIKTIKGAYYNARLKAKYGDYIRGNEFFTIPEVLDAVNTKTIFLLTTYVKRGKPIGVSKETMEEARKYWLEDRRTCGTSCWIHSNRPGSWQEKGSFPERIYGHPKDKGDRARVACGYYRGPEETFFCTIQTSISAKISKSGIHTENLFCR